MKRENAANYLVKNPLASAFARGFRRRCAMAGQVGETGWRGK
jgi:hypothetical protein